MLRKLMNSISTLCQLASTPRPAICKMQHQLNASVKKSGLGFSSGINRKLLFLLTISWLPFTFSCKEQAGSTAAKTEVAPGGYGTKAAMISKSGELFEGNSFLPLPLNHAKVFNSIGDSLDIVIFSKPILEDYTFIVPYGYFEVKDQERTRSFIFALPGDKNYAIMERMEFQDFMLKEYPIKQIIDTWFANYRGQSKTRVQNWKETYFAEDFLEQFLKMDIIQETSADTSQLSQ